MRPLPAYLLLTLVLISGCGRGRMPAADTPADTVMASCGSDAGLSAHDAAEAWADSLLSGMTLEEMAGQLVMPAVYSDAGKASIRAISVYAADCHVGGVVLLKGSREAAGAISDTLEKILPAPPFIAIDAEWGLAMRLEDTPRFPRNGRISMKAEDELLYDYGYEVARECRGAGINMVLGPVLDVLPPGGKDRGGVIGSRSFGHDPERTARLGIAYARGLEDGGVVSVAKHFPGHGSADADSHKRLPRVEKPRELLDSVDFLPFRRYCDSGLSGVMTGHLYVSALDSVERPVTVSAPVLQGLLRGEMGFGGLIVTDAMNMLGVEGAGASDAIAAGADIVLAPAHTRRAVEDICNAVRSGRMTAATLRDRVRRVLRFKHMFLKSGEYRRGADPDEAERIGRKLLE